MIPVVALSIASLSFASNTEPAYRTFTAPDGRTISAAVINHNSRNGKVQILREDGGKVWIPPTAFSEQDQEYIRHWIEVDRFMSGTGLKISGKMHKEDCESEIEGRPKTRRKADVIAGLTDVTYLIVLENKLNSDFVNLVIEYRAFIEDQGRKGKQDLIRVEVGQINIDCLPARSRIEKITDTFTLYVSNDIRQEYSSVRREYVTTHETVGKERLKGFWFRVYGPSIEGEKRAFREWCYPADTMVDYAWSDVSIGNKTKKDWRKLGIAPGSLAHTNPAEALKLMKEAYGQDADPAIAKNIGYTYLWLLEPHDIAAGLEWLKKGAEGDNQSACRLLSGFYSTYYGHMDYLDVEQAVLYGEKALSLKMDFFPHEIMGIAYARSGQFEKAVEHQQQAIQLYKRLLSERKRDVPSDSLATMKQHLEKMEQKLELYKNGKVE